MRFLFPPVLFGLLLLGYSTNNLHVSAGRFRLPRNHDIANRIKVNVPQLSTIAEYICPDTTNKVRRDIVSVPIDQLQSVLIELQEMEESVIMLISQYLIEGRLDSEDPSGVFMGTDGEQVVSVAPLSSTTIDMTSFSLSASSFASSLISSLSSALNTSNIAVSNNFSPTSALTVTTVSSPLTHGVSHTASQETTSHTSQISVPSKSSPRSASSTPKKSSLSHTTSENSVSHTRSQISVSSTVNQGSVSSTTSQSSISQTASQQSSSQTATETSIISSSTSTSTLLKSPTSSSIATTSHTSISSQATLSSSSSTSSVSSAPTSATSGSGTSGPGSTGNYVFNAQSSKNVAVYFGQTAATGGTSLLAQCASPDIDIVVLAFVIATTDGGQYPEVNFGAACGGQTPEMMAEAPGLLSCPLLASNITACQTQYGKKVMLSIGGAVSQISFSSSTAASSFATTLWNLFGPPGQVDPGLRPFGAVQVDGFDVDNEDNIPAYWPDFASTMRSLFATATSKTYYLSSAPQCPFPDASNPQALLLLCDFVFVQFYNNVDCQIGAGSGFTASVQQWSSALMQSSMAVKPRLYVGAPAFPAAGSSAYAAMGGPQGMEAVASSVEGMNLPNFGGAMFWDGPEGMLTQNGGMTIFGWAKAGFGQ